LIEILFKDKTNPWFAIIQIGNTIKKLSYKPNLTLEYAYPNAWFTKTK